MKDRIKIEVHQNDWMPGFAAFHKGKKNPNSKPFITINIGSMLALVENKDIEKSELPYVVAECLMHEIFHSLENWANVEFSEKRVEKLITKYRKSIKKGLS